MQITLTFSIAFRCLCFKDLCCYLSGCLISQRIRLSVCVLQSVNKEQVEKKLLREIHLKFNLNLKCNFKRKTLEDLNKHSSEDLRSFEGTFDFLSSLNALTKSNILPKICNKLFILQQINNHLLEYKNTPLCTWWCHLHTPLYERPGLVVTLFTPVNIS